MISLRQLRYFDLLAAAGHFGRAAERAGVTQPALSMQIFGLERALGGPLIERAASGARLTDLGVPLAQIESIGSSVEDPAGALRTIGRIGYAARAVVLAIIGVFFLVAAAQHDPSESKGMSGAVQSVADESWGRILLWLIAIGFVLFGVFCLAEAKLRRAA